MFLVLRGMKRVAEHGDGIDRLLEFVVMGRPAIMPPDAYFLDAFSHDGFLFDCAALRHIVIPG